MSKLTKASTYQLANGVEIPVIGLGTWMMDDEVAEQSVLEAIKLGYRHVDTAEGYGNEVGVGRGIKKSGIAREDMFVTTKLTNSHTTYEDAKKALEGSLTRLGMDYVDLYMIHWPAPIGVRANDVWIKRNADIWRYMEEALEQGLVRAISVSNFWPKHLDALLETAKVKPMINQIYFSPSDTQNHVFENNQKHGILTQAYSPLGAGTLLEVPELIAIADKYGKSAAQIALRWCLQKGTNPIPKSANPERMAANLDIFDFELTSEDMAIIEKLKGAAKVAKNPDEVDF